MNSPPSIPHEETSPTPMPENSGLAICSLVFALIGLFTVGIFSIPEAVSKRGGLDPVTDMLYDPWGNGYQVIIDVHSTGSIVVTRGGITETVTGRKAVVFSLGADGIAGTVDDVTTW